MTVGPAATAMGAVQARAATLLADSVKALEAEGRTELVARIRDDAARPRDRQPNVLVVGETKRGKSSLVNALLGHPGLSPVDADIATGAILIFRHAAEPFARVHLTSQQGDPVIRDINVADIGAWASVEENPGNRKGVRSVEVGLPAPLLADITIVDTPGVGGLEGGHAALTLQTLGSADAVMFVVDASAPLTSHELGFLSRAAERIDTVVLVMTKIDAHRGWETVARDNAALLSTHAPRFGGAPLIGVSSALAEEALSLLPADAMELRREAGIHQVETQLTRYVVRRAQLLGIVNVTRFATSALASVERVLIEQAAACEGSDEVAAALTAEEKRLDADLDDSADWGAKLESEIRRVSLWRGTELTRAITEMQHRYGQLVATSAKRDQESIMGQLTSEVTALAVRLAEETSRRALDAVRTVIVDIDAGSALAEHLDGLSELHELEPVPAGLLAPAPLTASEKLSGTLVVSSGAALMHLVPLPFALPLALAGAAPFAAGGTIALLFVRARQKAAQQAGLRGWINSTLQQARVQLDAEYQDRLIDAQLQLRRDLRAVVAARRAEVGSALDSCRRNAARDQAARQRARAEVEARLARVRELRGRGDALLAELQEARVVDGPPG